MANISSASNERIYSIPKWRGLNEHPDGDTRLKMGEASVMENWKITRDGNLKRRAGTELVFGLRLTYQVETSETSTEIGTYASTDSFTCYSIADATTVPGGITLTTSTAMTVAEILQSESTYYIWVDELPYQIDASCFTASGSSYVLNAFRIRATPTTTGTYPVTALWSGNVGGKQMMLGACNNILYSLYDADNDIFTREQIGAVATGNGVSFFPFDGDVYILNGSEYYKYDGTTLEVVEGYRPLIAITIAPVGSETGDEAGSLTGENINRLNGMRRVWLSPDGELGTFQLPETGLASIDYVTDLSTGSAITSYTADTTSGTIAFSTIPDEGTNTIEVGYSASSNYRSQVTSMLYAELFSGTTDTRIFLYGDGTNKTIYSGMDYDGMPRADYFPDQYEADIGDSNTPITSLIRHYSTLACYKTDSCWAMTHGAVELASGDLTPAIYSTPVNRDKGNVAMGQVRLVNNNPVTAFGHDLYSWSNSSYYTSNLTRDERQAKIVSERIHESLSDFDLSSVAMWDDNDNQEFYVSQDGEALVWNYANDTWYKYTDFDAVCFCNLNGVLYFGTSNGLVLRLTYEAEGDCGEPIEAYWESGAMDFTADYSRKYSSMMWVGLKPEDGTSVDVTVETDRKNTFRDKVVSSSKAKIAGQPFMVKTKIKAKKFVYYRLILQVSEKQPAVTVTNVDFRVRPTGYAK